MLATRYILAPLFFLLSGPVLAQSPGQWWWEAAVGLSGRGLENEIDGQKLNDYQENGVELGFDLHGYIVHPAIADFRIGLDTLLSRVNGQTDRDTHRLGLDIDLNLIPRGSYPVRLYLKRGMYDYSGSSVVDPFLQAGVPDANTVWGGLARIRKGPLTGLVAGLERTQIDFIRADARSEIGERDFLEWSRGDRFRHRVQLERRSREYGTIDLGIEDFFINLDERAKLSQSWKWDMFGRGLRRYLTLASGTTTTDNVRLRNRLLHNLRENDLLDLRYTIAATRFEDGPNNENHGVSIFYRWRPSAAIEVAPFGSYVAQKANGYRVRSPRAGISVTWRKPLRTMDAMLSARSSYGSIDYEGSPGMMDQSQFAWGFNGSLAHGRPSGLRKELEFDVTHDELRLTSVPTLTLPDLGLPQDGLGTENRYRSRLTLDHRWDASHIGAWGEWTNSQSSGSVATAPFETESLMGQLQFGTHGLGLSGSIGETRVRRLAIDEQDVSFAGASAWWSPRRHLTLKASYRRDMRELTTTPDIEGQRYETGLALRFGQLVIDALAYETSERLDGGSERTNRGVTWSISTRFAGALPILTGTKRRGVIR